MRVYAFSHPAGRPGGPPGVNYGEQAEMKTKMKRTIPAILLTLGILAISSASLALAEDFKTINGKEYKNATISRVEADGIVLRTKTGITKVYFTELPKEIQERFHYDPGKAAAEQAAVAQANAAVAQQQQQQEQQKASAIAAAQAQKYRVAGYISKKTKDGLIIRPAGLYEGQSLAERHYEADLAAGIKPPDVGKGELFLKGHPDQEKLADEDAVDVVGYETGTYSDGVTTYHCFTFYSR